MKLVAYLVFFSSTVLLICAAEVVNDSKNKSSNQNDSWLYYSMQIFNQTNEENMAPSETLLFHGYIPPVNHLEDYPQMVARKNLSYLQTPTSSPPAKESTDNKSQPDSIQDLLEPAGADQSSTTEQDTDLSEEKDPDSDDKEEPHRYNYDNDDDYDSARPELEFQPPDVAEIPEPIFGTSFEEDSFENRSDKDDEPDSDDYDRNDNQDSDDEDRILNNDGNRSNREDDSDEDEDGIEHEDFGDGGETKKIDEEILIPRAFIWTEHSRRPEADDATTGQNPYENDFDFDDTKFDKEYSQETRMAQPLILADQNDTIVGSQNDSTQTTI